MYKSRHEYERILGLFRFSKTTLQPEEVGTYSTDYTKYSKVSYANFLEQEDSSLFSP